MPIQLPGDLMVSVSGFRGRVGKSLDPALVTRLAALYGLFLKGEVGACDVLVGRDSRTSGPMFLQAVTTGLVSVGCEVTVLGLVPTPTLMLAVLESGAAGGIAVTASHNGADWNALKLAYRGGTFLSPDAMGRFRSLIDAEDPGWAAWDGLGTVTVDGGASQRHLDRIMRLPHVDAHEIRAAKIRVALDCVHGAGGAIMPRLLKLLGCDVRAIGTETDGLFPRDPEPTGANLGSLGRLVVDCGAQVGMAVDPDVDRLALTDERGRPLGEDLTLALAADAALRVQPGRVVTNLSTSRVIEDVAALHGSRVLRAPVGESNVVAAMIEQDAQFGGEGNGGVILPAVSHTRDAVLGAALVLRFLAHEPDVPISERAARLPSYHIVKEKVAFPRDLLAAAYAALTREWTPGRTDVSDGLRLEWSDEARWIHVRPSGTEPVVRLIAEAPDQAAAEMLVGRARDLLADIRDN